MLVDNLRRLFGIPTSELQKEFINRSPKKYDEVYYGKVVSVKDRKKYGRIKVRVFGIFDDFQTDDLPWAYPENTFIGSSTGSMIIPPVGSVVQIRFQNGDVHLPIYLGTKVHTQNTLPKGKSGIDPETIIFWELDSGDYFEVNQKKQEMTLKHSSGTEIYIDRLGTLHIKAKRIVDESSSLAIPDGSIGPFCALQSCAYAGIPHTSNSATGTVL